jgi:hypothetical protein
MPRFWGGGLDRQLQWLHPSALATSYHAVDPAYELRRLPTVDVSRCRRRSPP